MKKTLAIILAMALLCIMAVGTTLSYFTDTDGDVNTMTVGKVGITQKINGIENGGISVAMFPVTAGPETDGLVPTDNNGVNLKVDVSLDSGSQHAYVRTVFAFEMMWDGAKWVNPLDQNAAGYTPVHHVDETVIDFNSGLKIYKYSDNTYGTSEAGATAAYVIGFCNFGKVEDSTVKTSLKQVYLDSSVGNEFSDAIGGNYEILVLSQAVQTQGFGDDAAAAMTAAFGAIDATNAAKWFNEMPTP